MMDRLEGPRVTLDTLKIAQDWSAEGSDQAAWGLALPVAANGPGTRHVPDSPKANRQLVAAGWQLAVEVRSPVDSSLAETQGDSTLAKTDQETGMEQLPEMSQAVEQDDTTAVETKDQGEGGDAWDYKCHMRTKFAMTWDTHHGFENFALNCPQMQALAGAFTPDLSGFRPLTVVLHGRSGVGKSALARSIVLSWAHGEVYPGLFSYVFLFIAREVQSRWNKSFAELVSREWPDSLVPIRKILSQPAKLLFVVDGLDDLDMAPGDADPALCADWAEKRPVSILMRSLLKKVLLPECSLLVTVSDVGMEKLTSMLISPRYLLVAGLTVERRMQLFLEHLKSEDQETHAWHSLVGNHVLMDLCGAPVVCALICQALELQAAAGRSQPPTCQTLTGLYATFVFHQLAPRQAPAGCLSPEERVVFKGLCRMAAQGVWTMKFVFYGDELCVHGLTEPELSALFCKNLLLQDDCAEGCYTFLHPSLQEFCAALFYLLEGLEAEWDPHLLCVENMKNLVELRQISLNVYLLQMKHFLFGLMNGEVVRALEHLLGCRVAPKIRQVLLQWVSLLGGRAKTATPLDFLDSFYCLFETQDQEFVRLALDNFQEVRLMVNRPMDLAVSSFCLQHCQHLQKIRMDVREIFLEEESTKAGPVIPQGMLVKPLVSEWWEQLCSVLSTLPTLQQLDLSGSILNEGAMKTLCVQLRQPTCRIQRLILQGTQMTLGLPHLWKTLIINSNIKYLDLESTHLNDEGIMVAYEALKHPHCMLESLRLDHCGLTHTCCPVIAQILVTSTSLKSLSLAGNKVANQGVACLCESLKVSQCTVQKLILGNCGLAAADCQDLASLLISYPSLTHLDLSDNRLGAQGVALLCRALKLFTCALQRLLLRGCSLDVVGCGFLALGLMSNRHLTHLSLSMNPLGDDGVNLLCEVMVETSCHLQDLELAKCHLTAMCCKNLSDVITRSKHLWSLDLAANALGDSGVAALCEALKQKATTLRRLGLQACELTSGCCEVLSSALRSNQHLNSLNLTQNDFSPEGIQELCPAFAHPTSNLHVIGLWKWQYPGHTRKMLDEVQLRKPHLVIDEDWYAFDKDDRYWWKN
ncbi:NACHT, LRR and PYD domains-containing protein 5 [Saccopteryx leptura]|uniref:NACHT, LRR and PYD domains-containing protein 5 n=1 Tax=Saccopteryx leptura TaxID=249018 RepID=UPI00339C25FC